MAIDSQRKLHQWLDSAWCSHPLALHVIDEAAATLYNQPATLYNQPVALYKKAAATTLERRRHHRGPKPPATRAASYSPN